MHYLCIVLTAGAQHREVPVRHLTKTKLAELDRTIRQYDPTLPPDTTLPQTLRPDYDLF